MKLDVTYKNIMIGVLVILALLFVSTVQVREGQRGITLRLGQIVMNPQTGMPKVLTPGLYFRIPFIYRVRKFDVRLQTLDLASSRMVTAEKKDVLVDSYVKWRISNPALFYTRTGGNYEQATLLLSQQINDGLRAEFGRRTIREVISDDRMDIMETLNRQANLNAKNLGIDVIDVRIKRIDLPTEVSSAVYDRMRAERERVAAEHRAQGKAEAEAIKATADATASIIIATAKADASRLRGEGDNLAAKIYADAYNKDPSFYAFYRSLQAYKDVFADKSDTIVIKPNNQFLKYFNGVQDTNSNSIEKH